jgi:hypothetical protein
VTTHVIGGPFSPYHPVHNPHGDKTIPYKKPEDPPTVVEQREVKLTKDNYGIRMLQLPPLLRPTASHLAETKQTAKLIAFLNQYKSLPPAEDTQKLVQRMLGWKTVQVTIDDL